VTARRIALTGGIATGKSHVRTRFAALGVPTIDSDTLARQVVEPGTPQLAAVVARFGPAILDASGALNRRALGAIVFGDTAARRELEAILHPAIRAATEGWFGSLPAGVPFAIADIPLLYEVGRDRDFDAVVVAACAPEAQLARLMRRDGIDEAEARQRIAAQLPIADKVTRANFVITTDGTVEETDRQVDALYRTLTAAA
jgi:dephospho-CoA kinase